MSRSQNIQSIIGYGLPYVFVEKVKLTNSNSRKDDRSYFVNNAPSFIKNKFGTNEKQSKSELENRDFFTDKVYEAHLRLLVPELFISSRWFGKRSTTDMAVRVIQSTHPLATKALRNKQKYVEEDFSDELKPFIKQQTLSIPKNINLADYKTKEMQELGDILCLVPLEVSFKVNSNHLTYFVYCESGNSLGFRTIERVVDGGQTKSDSTCYYLPNGKVWSGPVHFHEGRGWMAGPTHTSRAHPSLRRVQHNNVKIQDYRIFRELEEKQNNITLSRDRNPRRVFSDLLISRDTEGGARGLFVFDMPRALVRHSRFNSLFLVNNKNDLAKQSRVQDLKIVRQRVEQKGPNDFDYVDQADLYSLVARSEDSKAGSSLKRGDYFIDDNMDGVVEKYVGSVSEKSLAGVGDRRAISFHDSEIKDFEPGVYRYGVEITMTDPTDDHLQLQIRRLKKAHSVLNEYYGLASNRQYYNPRGELDYQGVKLLGKIYGSSDMVEKTNSLSRFPWRRAVKLYLLALRELTTINTSTYSRKLYAILGPTSKTTEGVEVFLKLLESLIQKLASYDLKTPGGTSNSRSSASHNRSPDTGLITVIHYFDKPYRTGRSGGQGLDYFGEYASYNYTGPLGVSPSSFYERFSIEANRKGVDVPSAQNVQQYRELYSSIAPAMVKTAEKNYTLDNEESAREARLKLMQGRKQQNTDDTEVTTQGLTTYETLRYLLRQSGNSATVQALKLVVEDPCDPEISRTRPREDGEQVDTTKIIPGGQYDNFDSKETSKASGKDQQSDDPEQDVPLETLEVLVGEGDVLEEESVGVKYVTGFNRDLDIEYVDGPFSSELPYIVVMETPKDQNQDDVLNEILIVGDLDEKEPRQDQPVEEEPAPTEQPEPDKEVEEGGEDSSIDLPDNAEAVPEVAFNTGAEEVAKQTSSEGITRKPVADAPPTVARTEQEQTYLVGTTSTGGMTPRGGTGGY